MTAVLLAGVAEITHLLDLPAWPEGSRVICRQEDPHPGAQLTFSDASGHRFQCPLTDSADADVLALELRHRGHGRVEDRIRCARGTGCATPLPRLRLEQRLAAARAGGPGPHRLAQRLLLEGELAIAEPKRLRYALWHTAGWLMRHGRRIILRPARGWPWAETLAWAFGRLRALPAPT